MFLLTVIKTHTEYNWTLSQAALTCKVHWSFS